MDPRCPVCIVAHDVAIADQIRSQLEDRTGQQIRVCTYDDYRSHVVWHHSGIIYLTSADDQTSATRFIQEAKLQCSPLRLTLIQVGPQLVDSDFPDHLLESRARWPQDADNLARQVKGTLSYSTKKQSVSDALADRLVKQTPSLLPHVNRFAVAAAHDITVLLTGETGTGKTYLARLLHEYSPRRNHPFLMVPCGAQPTNLFESTFFGHVKGAFTGAHQTRVGRFASAGKGTILLDEIDALGLEQQASLLRVIETGEYELVGGNNTLHSEARIIVASNSDLAEGVAKETFRQDLFYRLNVMSFHLAPLRRRRQDIALLTRSIVARFNSKFCKGLYEIAPDALSVLEDYHWPGNIRQLENVLQEAVLTSTGSVLTAGDLPTLPKNETTASGFVPSIPPYTSAQNGYVANGGGLEAVQPDSLSNGRAAYESALIQKTLGDCRFIRARAARTLGVSRVTLYKKMKQYGLTDLPRQ